MEGNQRELGCSQNKYLLKFLCWITKSYLCSKCDAYIIIYQLHFSFNRARVKVNISTIRVFEIAYNHIAMNGNMNMNMNTRF